VVITPQAPPAPPPPPPPAKVQSARAKGDVRALFSGVEYPDAAIREGVQGSLVARLTVSPEGRVSDCSVLKSSGSTVLDQFACRILRRAKFSPAVNSNGQPTSDTYTTPTIRFELTG
jgi:protein TonB